MAETGVIKMSSKKMLSVLFLQNGTPWIIGAAGGILIFVLLGVIYDFRFLIVALIWLFLFVPLVTAFLYFFYGMRPLTTFNTIPHRIVFSEYDLTIQFLKDKVDTEETTSIEREYREGYDKFEKIHSGSDYLLLLFGKEGWIWVPINEWNKVNSLTENQLLSWLKLSA